MGFGVAEGMGNISGAFKGAMPAAALVGGSTVGYATGNLLHAIKDGSALSNVGRFAFTGAALGLGASAIGLGLRGVFGSNNIQEEGPFKGMLKGAAVGVAAGVGISALSGMSSLFRSDAFRGASSMVHQNSGTIGRGILGASSFAGSRFGAAAMIGGAAVGAGAVLLNSIISTNFTRAQ